MRDYTISEMGDDDPRPHVIPGRKGWRVTVILDEWQLAMIRARIAPALTTDVIFSDALELISRAKKDVRNHRRRVGSARKKRPR